MNIVLVDDEEMIVDMFTQLLEPVHDIRSTSSSVEALGMIEKQRPDLLITDYNMPEMDGSELAKAAINTHRIPVIMMTGNVNVTSDSDMIKVMYKPVNYREFLKTITEMGMMK